MTVPTVRLLVQAFLMLVILVGTAPNNVLAAAKESSATIGSSTAPTQKRCSLSEESQYEQIYDEIWLLVREHFLYRDRLKTWSNWRNRYDGKLASREAAEKAIHSMVDSLGDEYTFYRDEPATYERKCLKEKTRVVTYKMLPNAIGYLNISTFNSDHCVPETKEALSELKDAHGIILDLRENWGGSINAAFDVFACFANSGKFVTMKGTDDDVNYLEEMVLEEETSLTTTDGEEVRTAREKNLIGMKPLVVLVNENTKSAAEMLAGALRDNGRATIVGSKTFGKGIVQRVWEFPNNTSIKISSARFYLPSGSYIHHVGINPDLNTDMKGAKNVAANSLEHHASNVDRQLLQAQTVLRHKLVSLAH